MGAAAAPRPPPSATGARRDGPSRDHPGPRPDPDPARGAARAGEPIGVPPGSRVRRPDARRDRPVEGALPDRERRRPADDVVRDRRARIGDPERVLAGFFSERWTKLAEAHGLVVRKVEYDWGRRIVPEDVAAALAEQPVKAVLLTHSETSTGVIQPIRDLARVANEASALVIVDVVSSLGAVPFAFDEWGIDVAIGGSQKALSASPGIAFVAISERAWTMQRAATMPRFYFDWSIYKDYADKPEPENPWTPAISVMQGLHAALELYFQDGVDVALERHRTLSRAVKEGAQALGLDLFGEGLDDNWTVTAIRAPEAADADTISDRMRSDFGCVIAPGQGPLKGTVFRIGHFGYFSELDIIRGLAALEMTLERLGHPVKRGAAVAAAEGVFQDAHGA